MFDEFAWFVGVFEGEGSVLARKGVSTKDKRYLRIQIAMTDHDVIHRIHEVMGGRIDLNSHNLNQDRKNPHKKPMLRWRAEGSDAYQIVVRMLPYLGERRAARAREVLEITGYVNDDQLTIA